MESWYPFYSMAGAAAGALTGLVFVALSVNRDEIAVHAGYRDVARQAIIAFVSILTLAALQLIPVQGPQAFGAELMVGCGGGLLASLFIQRRVIGELGEYRRDYIVHSLGYNAGLLILGAGGLLLVLGPRQTGLLLLAPGVIVLGIVAIRNCWSLVMHVHKPAAHRPRPPGPAQG